MARSVARARSAERISLACSSVTDARTLRLQALDAIRSALDFDSYVWMLTDPQTWVGSAPLADVPCLEDLPHLIRARYLTAINRWTALPDPPVATLHGATGGDVAQSLVWRDVLSRYDIVDVVSLGFHDQFGSWGFLDLWRSIPKSPFDTHDVEFLAGVVEPLTKALRVSQANTFVGQRVAEREHRGAVVLMLSCDLEVLAQTPETNEYLRTLVPPAPGRTPVPSGAYNVAAQLLAVEAGVDAHPPTARVHFDEGRWVTLRASRIGDPRAASRRDIAVTIESTPAAERVEIFACAFGLTVREGELLGQLVAGADTRELARRMFVSAHTVQDHLKSIFAKTGTHSRRELLAIALGP